MTQSKALEICRANGTAFKAAKALKDAGAPRAVAVDAMTWVFGLHDSGQADIWIREKCCGW